MCTFSTCVCKGLSVLISPLLAFYVVGGELGEQWNHVAAMWSQCRIQHRRDGHLQHGPTGIRGMMGQDDGEWRVGDMMIKIQDKQKNVKIYLENMGAKTKTLYNDIWHLVFLFTNASLVSSLQANTMMYRNKNEHLMFRTQSPFI